LSETGSGTKPIASNRKASRNFHVLQKFEAGIELTGTEVKSLRGGQASLDEGFARVEDRQVFLYGVHIKPYDHGNLFNHEPRRTRRLLLHRAEINRLTGIVAQKGFALIPLRMYFRRGRAKVELGVCRGKDQHDRRETLKRKTADREAARAISAHRGRT
jgi:SsrA-binding protein